MMLDIPHNLRFFQKKAQQDIYRCQMYKVIARTARYRRGILPWSCFCWWDGHRLNLWPYIVSTRTSRREVWVRVGVNQINVFVAYTIRWSRFSIQGAQNEKVPLQARPELGSECSTKTYRFPTHTKPMSLCLNLITWIQSCEATSMLCRCAGAFMGQRLEMFEPSVKKRLLSRS